MTARAVLLDIDGTLVDSNYLHIEAWSRAFHDAGVAVDAWTIHRGIGMDSEKLLDSIAGSASEEQLEAAKSAHSRYYEDSADRLRSFDGARELLRELTRRGLTVVLATSAPEDELEKLRATLDIEDALDVVTSSEDVDTAKPSPDLVHVALERAGVGAADAVMIGDTVWDVEAANNAGVRCIGVLSGGVSTGELRDAGAIAVYRDVADLLARLDDSAIA